MSRDRNHLWALEHDLEARGGGGWLACEHPERPPDVSTIWVWACDACYLHLTVAAARSGDDEAHSVHGDGTYDLDSTLAGIHADATEWRAAHAS